MGLKGVTKIELTDVNTGEVEVHESENMVTNAISDILNLNPLDLFYRDVYNIDNLLPIAPNLIGGIFLFSQPLIEDATKYYQDVGLMGYSSNDVYTGVDSMRGSMNQTESGPLTGNESGYRFVFDFATSQANGTIKSMGLTSKYGGVAGFGVPSAGPNDGKIIEIYNYIFSSGSQPSNLSRYRSIVCTDTTNSRFLSVNVKQEGGGVNIYSLPYKNLRSGIGLSDKLETAINIINKSTLLSSIDFNTFLSVVGGIYDTYVCFLDGEDGYIYGFMHANNASGNSSGNATIWIAKINKSTWAATEYTCTIPVQIYRFGTKTKEADNIASNNYNSEYSIIKNGYLYCLKYDRRGIYKIPISKMLSDSVTQSDIVVFNTSYDIPVYNNYSSSDTIRIGGTTFNSIGDVVYFGRGYISNNTLYNNEYINSYGRGLEFTASPNTHIGPYLLSTYTYNYGYGQRPYASLYLKTPYLATINNLSSDIVKTQNQTMKITYTLTETTT